MCRLPFVVSFMFVCPFACAQTAFEYDAMGNRVQRHSVYNAVNPSGSMSSDTVGVQLHVSPNPTTGLFTLTISGTTQATGFPIVITDAYGTPSVTARSPSPTAQLNISSLPDGYYLVYVTVEGKKYCRKIVKSG